MTTLTVAAGEVQPEREAVTLYVPLAAVCTLAMVGEARGLLNPFGPDQV